MMNLITILTLGFFLGVRHATDTDHVVAVAAIVSRERTPRAALGVGALWGLGHTATILLVGGAIVLFGLVIPPRLGLSMEMSVAVMLVVLGVMNVTGAARTIREKAERLESRGDEAPGEPGLAQGWMPTRRARVLRPLIIGVIHGLAGSAAIALLVLATIRTAEWALVYLAVFGFGTILGMAMLTSAMAVPMARAAARSENFERVLVRFTGLVSIGLGLFLAYRIGFVDGLLVGGPPSWTPD
jgi:high-affinity nickel-transport protein